MPASAARRPFAPRSVVERRSRVGGTSGAWAARHLRVVRALARAGDGDGDGNPPRGVLRMAGSGPRRTGVRPRRRRVRLRRAEVGRRAGRLGMPRVRGEQLLRPLRWARHWCCTSHWRHTRCAGIATTKVMLAVGEEGTNESCKMGNGAAHVEGAGCGTEEGGRREGRAVRADFH
ncbi:hypothetical protein DFH08DRAFT_432334 [Mycena albidolilacea]|uniref:Uncharacterized protein n=1 Tax=Mycena albidolilacea TaxID=1033008 RepID=A0AAD6ZAF4_9AGAR|nr:hypothetical protein DFH08DRAFT_432334 [Mycena albidolilacea]